MSYSIEVTPDFEKDLKRLSKKHGSIKNDLASLIGQLAKSPKLGTSLGEDLYKIRMAITSKGKGKSGGSRVITYVQVLQTTVYLLSIYDKSDKENISDKQLKGLLKYIPE